MAQGQGWHVRLATREDNEALLRLMLEVPMPGGVVLAQDRRPDFFAASRLHEPAIAETGIAIDETTGEAVGCGTYVMRDAWWPDGTRGKVGYLSDLRLRPSHRGGRLTPAWGKGAFERARDRHGTEVFLTSLVAKNDRVVRLAARRHPDQPVSRPIAAYSMLSVQVAGRNRASGADVRRAAPADLDAMVRFLAEAQRARAFGYVVDRKLLETRLATWPGLTIGDFRLAIGRDGAIVGCCAPWDASAVRRNLALRWRGALGPYRAAFNAVAPLLRAPRLPAPGEALRFAALSHLEIRDDDPTIARALVIDALAQARERRQPFVGAIVVDGSPIERAFRRLLRSRTRLVLNATMLPTSAHATRDFRSPRPAFELALA